MPRKHSSDEPARAGRGEARRGAEGRGEARRGQPRPSLAARTDWEAACRETPRCTPRPPPWPPRLFPLPAKAVIVTELSAVGSEGPCLGPRTTQGTSCLRGGTCSGHALGGSRGGRVAGGPVARPSVHVRPASPAGHRPATHPPPPALTVSPDCPGPRGCGSPGAGCGCYGGACVGRRDMSGWAPTAPAGAGGGRRLERDGGGRSTDGWPQRSGPRSPATQRLARLRKSHAPGLGRPRAAQV